MLQTLKKRKLELEIRKLELDVWEKETLLGVPHCNLTSDIHNTTMSEKESTSILTGTLTDISELNGGTIVVNDDGQLMVIKSHISNDIMKCPEYMIA